jgi:hypothetical protein
LDSREHNRRRDNSMRTNIFLVEKNIRGAWVVYGALGVRQYYGYTKKEAIQKYKNQCQETFVTAQ